MVNITPQMLQTGATSCNQTAHEVTAELASMRSQVEVLAGQWLGVSSTAYQTLMADYDRYGRLLNDTLIEIGEGLVRNMNNYTTTESTVETRYHNINADLPPARLG
jgi:WXG100 family type VII secretion target